MQDLKRGTVRASQLTFDYLTQGDGPLALCVHEFPDSPYSYRYLLAALAAAGKEPERWRRCVVLNIPPFAIFGCKGRS